jgi:hypothetical protein
MKQPDFSDYEKRRAENHETEWRLAATFDNIRSRHCRYRMCRREQFCCGPMLPSAHQNGVIRAHREIGLSGTACSHLPMCMANATSDRYASVRDISKKLTELREGKLKDTTIGEFVFLMRMHLRRQHRD